jgi:hypothetical protein
MMRRSRFGLPAFLAAALAVCVAGTVCGQPAALKPPADLVQEASLEAARQDLVETQLAELIARFGDLIRDLGSNRDVGTDASKIAAGLRDRLSTIHQVRLGHARKRLDEALREPATSRVRLADAQRQIELAARELGSLLLQAGVAHACEVFATELREIIARQESLRAALSGPAEAQQELAERIEKLLEDIRAIHESPVDALAAVRLARARKIIEGGQVGPEMRRATEELRTQPASAADRQGKALKGLRQGLLKLRPDARLEELVRARNMLKDHLDAQKALRTSLATLTGEALAPQRAAMGLRQEAIARSLKPLDGTLEIDAFLNAAQQASREASTAIGSGDGPAAATAQSRVEAALSGAIYKLGDQIAKLGVLGETHKRMLEAADRLKGLTELRDRADQIKNGAFEAATAGKGLEGMAAAQQQLGKDIDAFATGLPSTSKFASAMRRPLKKTARAVEKSAGSLKAQQLNAATPEFLKAEQSFKETFEIAKRELGVLEKLWLFQQASADIQQIRQAIEDVEGEQADLRADVEAARKAGRTVLDLTGPQALLARAAQQVQENAGAIREAAPLKEPLDAALAAMNQASGLLEKDQAAPAMESQQKAIASLHQSRKVASGIISQIDLIVVEIDAASELSGRAMDLLQRQIVLRETTEEAPETDFPRLAGEQDILLAETTVLTTLSVAPKAATAFKRAADEMTAAIQDLKATGRAPAVEHQKKAEDALREGILALDEYILSLMALLQSASGIVMEYRTALDGLTAILLLATEQRELRELTLRTPDAVLPTHVEKQEELRERTIVVSNMPNILTLTGRITGWEHIEAAAKAMERAVGTLKASAKNESIAHQQLAEKELRIAFAMNVVELINALKPPPPGTPGTVIIPLLQDRPTPLSLDHWMEFSKASPSGKVAQGSKSEWSSLVDRERAALNENFARELPLEFRKLLKDYYEALSK